MKKINVAIAGFGYSSQVFHLPFLLNHSQFIIKKIYERTTSKSLKFLPYVQIVRNFQELLTQEIDLVIITTPNQIHYEMAKQAISAGKNVLVEKPLVTTSKQAQELIQLANQHKVILTVYQNRRWDSPIATAKDILYKNLIGTPVDCEIRMDRYTEEKNPKVWKETGDLGTGLVYDLGVHLLDQSVYLFGQPDELFADIRYQHKDTLVDDNFTIHLYYHTGLKVTLNASKYAREPAPHFILQGTKGSYIKKAIDNQENLLKKGIKPINDWNAEPPNNLGILHTEMNRQVIRQFYPNVKTSYNAFYDNLYFALTKNIPLAIKPEQAYYVLTLIEKAFESAKIGQKLKINTLI
ncbi:putative dehydrogenase [Bisgaardia hudsonensis]|uniref:Putative dehydrogenase n=1 Tax=Bisgaardia hudsonensis TaxID=109472 RepID=A0A4R2N1C2_9PAST|nr:Gfo/Idh/MocA family oxidoreductase [Bisgaardia hudsonensis]QLB13094.1 oxidoreductase [Bisgaardia hudsonensis]TCP13339.1 putative dehydrogenase [Bisgaardia hudsonensis]